jgi:hypothetical protein
VPASAAVEEFAAARAQERQDVLEVGCGARRGAERRRIERATARGEEDEARETAADLEAARADVLVRQPIAREMKDRAEQDRREPRPAGGAGRGARRHVKRDDHDNRPSRRPRETRRRDLTHLACRAATGHAGRSRCRVSNRKRREEHELMLASLAGPQRCTGVGSGGAAGCADEVAGLPRHPGRVASGGEAEANVAGRRPAALEIFALCENERKRGPSAHDLPGAVSSPRCPRAARTPSKQIDPRAEGLEGRKSWSHTTVAPPQEAARRRTDPAACCRKGAERRHTGKGQRRTNVLSLQAIA